MWFFSDDQHPYFFPNTVIFYIEIMIFFENKNKYCDSPSNRDRSRLRGDLQYFENTLLCEMHTIVGHEQAPWSIHSGFSTVKFTVYWCLQGVYFKRTIAHFNLLKISGRSPNCLLGSRFLRSKPPFSLYFREILEVRPPTEPRSHIFNRSVPCS